MSPTPPTPPAEAVPTFDPGTLPRLLLELQQRRPWATWGLAAAIALSFALQLAWGHGDPLLPLFQMGSLIPQRVLRGEAWRLLASVFLHAGFQHAAFNALALVVLGSFVEKVLGGRRLLVIVLASAIGGNLVSLAVHGTGQSVGASGGIWGLLGAGAVLGFRSGGVLHPALVPGVRRAATINLGLNVMVSFLPQINMAAHFGGGAVGAALLFGGALTRGLPRYDDGIEWPPSRSTPGWLTPAAWLLAAVFVAGIGWAWAEGRPWRPATELRWQRVTIERLDLSVEVPSSLEQRSEPDVGEVRFEAFGDLRTDLLVVRLGVAPREGLPPGARRALTDDLRLQLLQPPEGLEVVAGPDPLPDAGRIAQSALWRRRTDGVLFEVAARIGPQRDLIVHVIYPGRLQDAFRGTAGRVLTSIEPVAPR